MESLPDYMKVIYKELLKFYEEEIEQTVGNDGREYALNLYVKEVNIFVFSSLFIDISLFFFIAKRLKDQNKKNYKLTKTRVEKPPFD